ncbi:unnamed protein product [Amoebophrya sp. A120]|nr:unnamed protein product [Amoebophrya sp. A120]|eukprot:GSA120T00012118001.1
MRPGVLYRKNGTIRARPGGSCSFLPVADMVVWKSVRRSSQVTSSFWTAGSTKDCDSTRAPSCVRAFTTFYRPIQEKLLGRGTACVKELRGRHEKQFSSISAARIKNAIQQHHQEQAPARNPATVGTARGTQVFPPLQQNLDTDAKLIQSCYRLVTERVDRPIAVNLIPQLDCSNLLGFPSPSLASLMKLKTKKSLTKNPRTTSPTVPAGRQSLLREVLLQKEAAILHSATYQQTGAHSVVFLTRVGDFYEAWGFDAVLCVQFCGLNPMGGKAKCGCPKSLVQQTCDALTTQGFSVAIYEEVAGDVVKRKNAQLKQRFLAQIVTAAQPTYRYGMSICSAGTGASLASSTTSTATDKVDTTHSPILGAGLEFMTKSSLQPRPVVALRRSVDRGFDLCEIDLESQTFRRLRGLTREAVRTQLERLPGVAQLVCFHCSPAQLPFLREYTTTAPALVYRVGMLGGGAFPGTTGAGGQDVGARPSGAGNGVFVANFVHQALRMLQVNDSEIANFREVSCSSSASSDGHQTLQNHEDLPVLPPLGVGVARFLGLTSTKIGGGGPLRGSFANGETTSSPSSPNLISCLLPQNSPAYAHRWLQEWLLSPPVSKLRTCFAEAVKYFRDTNQPLPGPESLRPVKFDFASCHNFHQAGSEFQVLKKSLKAFLDVEKRFRGKIVETSIFPIAAYHSGVPASVDVVRIAEKLVRRIEETVVDETAARFGDVNATGTNAFDSAVGDEEIDSIYVATDTHATTRQQPDFLKELLDFAAHKEAALNQSNILVCREGLRDAFDAFQGYADLQVGKGFRIVFRKALPPKRAAEGGFSGGGDGTAAGFSPSPAHDSAIVFQDALYLAPVTKKVQVAKSPRGDSAAIIDEAENHQHPSDPSSFSSPHEPTKFSKKSSTSTLGPRYRHGGYRPLDLVRLERDYLRELENCEHAANAKIRKLAQEIQSETAAVAFISHTLVVVSVASLHAEESLRRGWTFVEGGFEEESSNTLTSRIDDKHDKNSASTASLAEETEKPPAAIHLRHLYPYWLQSPTDTANPQNANTISLQTANSVVVLTAPNASGKSCLLRSFLAVVLLHHCGLFAPVAAESFLTTRISSLQAFHPTGDCPVENRSAFENEIAQMSEILQEVNDYHSRTKKPSLIMIDEFGRGTSAREATALAAAILEYLKPPNGFTCTIFATHLHEIYPLLETGITATSCMARTSDEEESEEAGAAKIDAVGTTKGGGGSGERATTTEAKNEQESDYLFWRMAANYKLESGKCTNSEALHCAKRGGLPAKILERAEALLQMEQEHQMEGAASGAIFRPAIQAGAVVTAADPVSDTTELEDAAPKNFPMAQSESHVKHDCPHSQDINAFEENQPDPETAQLDVIKLLMQQLASTQQKQHQTSGLFPPDSDSTCNSSKIDILELSEAHSRPPASVNARPCVYCFKLQESGRFYVGETASLRQRLMYHKRTKGSWSTCLCVVVNDKSAAQFVETALIQELCRREFPMHSANDGNRRVARGGGRPGGGFGGGGG